MLCRPAAVTKRLADQSVDLITSTVRPAVLMNGRCTTYQPAGSLAITFGLPAVRTQQQSDFLYAHGDEPRYIVARCLFMIALDIADRG